MHDNQYHVITSKYAADSENLPIVTIFTPCYNYGRFLHRLYASLCCQTCKQFKWIIIDDGSTDDTRTISEQIIRNHDGFQIKYRYKDNGGLHTAYNSAIELLDTELAVCIDADDWMPEDAVEVIVSCWGKIDHQKYGGIIGLDRLEDGKILGDPFPPEMIEIRKCDEAHGKYSFKSSDRKDVVRSDLYKSVAPQPSFPNEKYFNPSYMLIQISRNYPFYILNRPLCIVEYQPDGMSANIYKQYVNSPRSFAELRKLDLSFDDLPFLFCVKRYIQYWSSCFIARRWCGLKNYNLVLLSLTMPFGLLLSFVIRARARH